MIANRPRLSSASLDTLPQDVERPGYDRGAVAPGVVHLGIGAFHRAHQAAVFDDLIRRGDRRWGVRSASLRSSAVFDQLSPQDGLYSLVVRHGEAARVRVIGAVKDVLVAPSHPSGLIAALADPQTHLVTLTITEKGYRLDPASGAFLLDDMEVRLDLKQPDEPRTAPGFLVAALAARRARGLKPFTALSCDNLPQNGRRLRSAVLAMAGRTDPGLRDWIEAHGAFPETMVDRIVPATTPSDIEALADRLGVLDLAMVKTEPFRQWVIEDRFAGERPDFEAAGVQVVAHVAPYEAAKLRLLNGAHSAIAYLGGLAGLAFVHEVVAWPAGRRLVERLWDESAATLTLPAGFDLVAYRRDLMSRFANPALQHATRQIAMDGSQKLPQRLIAPLAERLAQGLPVDALALAVAAWMRWQSGRDDAGAAFAVDDPLAALTRRAIDSAGDTQERVSALLSISQIFPPALATTPALGQALVRALSQIERLGARGAVEAL
ncbi:MAG TPA: mannitol dehydrogenase family protein [Caulobacteraceae bacterium]|jgi:fructuronate reductase